MALTDAQAARLAKLQTAYDALIGGSKVQRISTPNGPSVEYGPGDTAKLKAEIDQLNAAASTSAYQRGAIRFTV